jgi:hypothetical protein
MLALSRVESAALPAFTEVGWQPIVEEAMSDCLALAERRLHRTVVRMAAAGRHPHAADGRRAPADRACCAIFSTTQSVMRPPARP